jgi:hypothetical protein
VVHARRARELLATLPEGADRDELELRACWQLATALQMVVGGSAEQREVVLRLRDLAVRLDRPSDLHWSSPLLIACLHSLGEYEEATVVGEEALALAGHEAGLAAFIQQFHGCTLVWRGRVEEGYALIVPLLEQSLGNVDWANDPMFASSAASGWSLAALVDAGEGRADLAAERFATAATAGKGAVEAVCLARCTESIARQLAGDAAGVHERAAPALDLALDAGNDWWFVWAQVLLGWSATMAGDPTGGVAMMEEAIAHNGHGRQLRPYFLALLAEGQRAAGDVDRARRRIEEARALVEITGERFFVPEIERIAAVL